MDDVFDESANEMTVSANDYERENESIKKAAMLEGVDKGKTATIQAGFDKGYAIAMKYIHQVDFAKGYITIQLRDSNEKDVILKEISQLRERLLELCESNLDDSMTGQIETVVDQLVTVFESKFPGKSYLLNK